MIFDRVVCGVDGTPEGLAAARQGARLASPDGRLVLVVVVETVMAVHGGWAASELIHQLRGDAEEALEAARSAVATEREPETRLVEGALLPTFKAELEHHQPTLVCIGATRHSRAGGLLLGSLPTMLLHEGPCSVLVARPHERDRSFPSAIVAGVDSSPAGEDAAAAGGELAERFGADLELVVAGGGKNVDVDAVRAAHPAVRSDERKPVDLLVEASEGADLLVLGSRGLHGLRALGSVSERVAHQAQCSVLVVR